MSRPSRQPHISEKPQSSHSVMPSSPHIPNLPTGVIADEDDLLLKGSRLGVLLRPEPKKVNHAVTLLVTPTDTMHSDSAYGQDSEGT